MASLPTAIPQANKTSYLLVMVSALYPAAGSLTSAVTEIIAHEFQIYVSIPDLRWHALSLQTQ